MSSQSHKNFNVFSEINDLKEALKEAYQEIRSLKEYIHLRDGIQFDDFYQRVRETRIKYQLVEDERLRRQLEEDNLMMLRARAEDDFLGYCQSAFLQIEAFMDEALWYVYSEDKTAIDQAWQTQQQRRKEREESRGRTYTNRPLNPNRTDAGDLLEAFFILLYKTNFTDQPPLNDENEQIYSQEQQRYWTLVNAKQLRNILSHRDASKTRLERIKEKNKLYEFYRKRHALNYYQVVESMRILFSDLYAYRDQLQQKALSKSTEAQQS